MKKNLLLSCLSLLTIIFISSCCKEDLPGKHNVKSQSQNITVQLIKNQTYSFTLPENLSGEPYRISSQAEHFSVSGINGDKIYTYTPASNYTGNDMVVIANGEQHNNNNNNNCGGNNHNNNGNNCGQHNFNSNNNGYDNNTKVEQTITINFIIKDKEGKNSKTVIGPAF